MFRALTASLLAASLVLAAGAPALAAVDLPSIGEPADTTLSPIEESKLGKNVIRQLRQQGYMLDDIELTTYIRSSGRRLASFAEANPAGFDFFIIKDTRINAFALPGGYIGINAGLLLAARNESELAGVLSHEIAHVTQRHIARQIDSTKGMNMAAMAAMLVAVIASGGNADVAQAAIAVSASAAAQTQINFTRAHEHEADRLGIRTLASAGYDPGGMGSFFEKLDQQTRLYGDTVPEMLRSHPVNVTRISEARSRAAAYPAVKARDESEFRLMQARVRVLTAQQPSEAVTFFEGRLKTPDATDSDRYGLALAQLNSGQAEPAYKTFRALAEKNRGQPHYLLAQARAELATPHAQQAIGVFERGQSLFPDHPALAAAHAEALLRFKRPNDARRVILATSGALDGEVPEMQRLLAVAAQDLGWQAEALFRMGEYYELQGDYSSAYNQYEAALRIPDLSVNDKARISSKMETLKKEAPQEAKRRERLTRLLRSRP